jgi:hypothetical protein
MEILIIVAAVAAAAPLFYVQHKVSKAAIEFEKSQYDDSDCAPGFTNYPGPM